MILFDDLQDGSGSIYFYDLDGPPSSGGKLMILFDDLQDGSGSIYFYDLDGPPSSGGDIDVDIDIAGEISIEGQSITAVVTIHVAEGAITITGQNVDFSVSG